MFKIEANPESPNEGAYLTYMMNRNRQMRGHVKHTFLLNRIVKRERAFRMQDVMNRQSPGTAFANKGEGRLRPLTSRLS